MQVIYTRKKNHLASLDERIPILFVPVKYTKCDFDLFKLTPHRSMLSAQYPLRSVRPPLAGKHKY